jgi:hypothetical protein
MYKIICYIFVSEIYSRKVRSESRTDNDSGLADPCHLTDRLGPSASSAGLSAGQKVTSDQYSHVAQSCAIRQCVIVRVGCIDTHDY